jgi:serine/threonine protein kinase
MNDEGASSKPERRSAVSSPGAASDRADPPYACQILRSIGRGAYGEVFLARDAAGAYRAVKVISRESFDHDRPFEREYEGIRKFEVVSSAYPNQVQIFNVSRREQPSQFSYVMELADDQYGGRNIEPETYVPKTLRSELKRRGRLPATECIGLGLVLARAVENLHENGLIHRDIKPANIIFVHDQPKLADIGLVTGAEMSVSHVGTEGFIPPEGPGSAQADIYSLGKVLYEMCTGLDRSDFPELPANLQTFPDREMLLELNLIVAKACEHDPRKRYRSAHEMAGDFQYLWGCKSVRRRRVSQRRFKTAGIVFLALAICGLLLAGVHRLRQTLANARKANVPETRVPIPDDPRNLIVNGSFERPMVPLPRQRLLLPKGELPKWRTTAETFELWRNGTLVMNKFAVLSAHGFQNLKILSTSTSATVWQTVPTLVGTNYAVSFFHTPQPGRNSILTFSVNADPVATFNEDGRALTNFNWQRFFTNFIATSDSTTLRFSDRALTSGTAGAHLDDVVLMQAADGGKPILGQK